MGLLDGIFANMSGDNPLGSILGGVGGGGGAHGANLLTAAMSMLQDHGGLASVLDAFRRNGMADNVASWVGTGSNLGISAGQVAQVFGPSSIGGLASHLGMSHDQAGSAIANLLPELVNQLTPEGRLPDGADDLLAKGLAMLRGGTA